MCLLLNFVQFDDHELDFHGDIQWSKIRFWKRSKREELFIYLNNVKPNTQKLLKK